MDLIGSYSNRQDLADALVSAVQQLRRAQGRGTEAPSSVRSTRSASQWRVGDRLSEADTERLVAAFVAGTSKRKLAERYGISESSVKRLIRQHGASKPSSGLRRHQSVVLPSCVAGLALDGAFRAEYAGFLCGKDAEIYESVPHGLDAYIKFTGELGNEIFARYRLTALRSGC